MKNEHQTAGGDPPPLPFKEVELSSTDDALGLPIDIGEDEYEYFFAVEAPGVPVDDVTVETELGLLRIAGSARPRAAEQSKRYLHTEREFGKYSRSFTVPGDAELSRLHYDMRDGVLHIHIPKVRLAGCAPAPLEARAEGKEKAIDGLEPDLAVERPNLVRTITQSQESA